MTAERFHALTAAYGADRRRWPDDERAAAEAFAADHPGLARPALAEADAIDALLHRSPTPQVSMALRDRVLAAATSAGAGPIAPDVCGSTACPWLSARGGRRRPAPGSWRA